MPEPDWGYAATRPVSTRSSKPLRRWVSRPTEWRLASLIEEVDTARATLYGDLAKKAAEAGLPIAWPGRFFRRAPPRSRRIGSMVYF
jgi:hypothetical protein